MPAPTRTDEQIMDEAFERWDMGRGDAPTDLQAKVIASAYHGGQNTAMYAFASSGAILPGLYDEVYHDINLYGGRRGNIKNLWPLLSYIYGRLPRGPMGHWHTLNW